MKVWIRADLHADLSPLLVKASTWPAFSDLEPIPGPEVDEGPNPRALRSLKESLPLVHPSLLGPRARRIYWTKSRALYYRLVPPNPEAEKPPPEKDWLGWLSWAPCPPPIAALSLCARLKAPRGPANLETLTELLAELLVPDLMDEVRASNSHPAPAAQGPDDYAAITRLDPAGYGAAWSCLYAYTNGARVVVALQPLVHTAMDGPPAY